MGFRTLVEEKIIEDHCATAICFSFKGTRKCVMTAILKKSVGQTSEHFVPLAHAKCHGRGVIVTE